MRRMLADREGGHCWRPAQHNSDVQSWKVSLPWTARLWSPQIPVSALWAATKAGRTFAVQAQGRSLAAQRRPFHRAADSLPQVRQALQLQAVPKQRQPLSTDTSKAWPETGNKSTASCWLLPAWLLLMQMMGNPQAWCCPCLQLEQAISQAWDIKINEERLPPRRISWQRHPQSRW